MEQKSHIRPFLDDEGKIKALPVRQSRRCEVLAYLAAKFRPGRDYTEQEVNTICDAWHTFGDHFLLRRELVDSGLLCRMRDGSRYWRPAAQAEGDPDTGLTAGQRPAEMICRGREIHSH